jgi:predicted esterase
MQSQSRRGNFWSMVCVLAFALAAGAPAPVAADPRSGAFALEQSSSEILGARAAAYASILDPDARLVWDVYAPAPADAPPGVFVFISPLPTGAPPEHWRRVLDEFNLIWISARQSGNEVLARKRFMMAFLALEAIKQQTDIDSDRVYIGGFSGGGRVASMVASELPALFRGGMYFVGVNWDAPPDEERLQQMRGNRFVFITGRRDFNRRDTRRVFSQYRRAEIEQVLLMDLDYLGHRLPRTEDFENGVRFLDGLELVSQPGADQSVR